MISTKETERPSDSGAKTTPDTSLQLISTLLDKRDIDILSLEEAVQAINNFAVNDESFGVDVNTTFKILNDLHNAISGDSARKYLSSTDSVTRIIYLQTLDAIAKVSNFLVSGAGNERDFHNGYFLGDAAVQKLSDIAFHAYMIEQDSRTYAPTTVPPFSEKLLEQADHARDAIRATVKIINSLGKEQIQHALSLHAGDIISRTYADITDHPRLLASRISIINELIESNKENQLINPVVYNLARASVEYCRKVLNTSPDMTNYHPKREVINRGLSEMRQEAMAVTAKHNWDSALSMEVLENAARLVCRIGPDGYGRCTNDTMAFFGNRVPDAKCVSKMASIMSEGLTLSA